MGWREIWHTDEDLYWCGPEGLHDWPAAWRAWLAETRRYEGSLVGSRWLHIGAPSAARRIKRRPRPFRDWSWSLLMANLEGRCDLRWIDLGNEFNWINLSAPKPGTSWITDDAGEEVMRPPEFGELSEAELTRGPSDFLGQLESKRVRKVLDNLEGAQQEGPVNPGLDEEPYPLGSCLICADVCRRRSPLCKKCQAEYGDSPAWPEWLQYLRASQSKAMRGLQAPKAESLDAPDPRDEELTPLIDTAEADPNSLWTGKRSRRAQAHDRRQK